MLITKKALETIQAELAQSENGQLIGSLDDVWALVNAENTMRAAQERLAAKPDELGLSIEYAAIIYPTPEGAADRETETDEHRGYRVFPIPDKPHPIDLQSGTLRALSIQQPWVERILTGQKNVEYRTWRVTETGPLLLHASRTQRPKNFEAVGMQDQMSALPYGALVGIVDVVGVEYNEHNEEYEWLLAHPRRFRTPIPYKGAAGIFRVPTHVVAQELAGATA
ncbi:ASCH domain-containing protein [Deinococcus sp. YIM 77859]|uniref:ASCH domain-containing protein n=1 Tax=Deinococcus sp. YIM 77859 TaxID=1540221 RepID=UPI00054D31B4|nr:ASCH domain-containing protein [Deinococcus sp. YIM 77859]